MDLRDGVAYWPARDGIRADFPPLRESVTADVVVVGAGITGALIALELASRGLHTVVIDRRDVASGSTAASTAMLQYEIDEPLTRLTERFGRHVAEQAYRECGRGIDLVEAATRVANAPSGFRRSPSLQIAVNASDCPAMLAECGARAEAGFEVTWLERDALSKEWGLDGAGAILSRLGASVDPYALAVGALLKVVELGGEVFDRTEIVAQTTSRGRVTFTTDRGTTLTAPWAVYATGYEVKSLLPDLPMKLNSTFAFVSEPVPELEEIYPDGMLFWEFADPYLYGRTTDDRRVLIGGADEPYRDPRRRKRAMTAKLRRLERAAKRRLPRLVLETGYWWSGTFAETPDGLAYIGTHPQHPRCHFALGFGGNGITYSALAAQYISAAIIGDEPEPDAQIFRLDRADD